MTTQCQTDAVATSQEIQVEGATVRWQEDGIIDVILAENADVTLESARAMNAALHELTDRPSPVLADIRAMRSTGILQMRFANDPKVTAVTRRLAVLVGSPVSRMIGNMFLGLAKPPYPTRLFTEERAATAWLLEEDTGG